MLFPLLRFFQILCPSSSDPTLCSFSKKQIHQKEPKARKQNKTTFKIKTKQTKNSHQTLSKQKCTHNMKFIVYWSTI